MNLQIPKLRQGSFFPSLLGPRRRIDKALWAVVNSEAFAHGVSTRKVDDLVQARASRRGSPRARSAGSAASSTPWWPSSGTGP